MNKPYITADIKQMMKERDKMQRKYARKPITHGEAYRRIRNMVCNAIKSAKANYYKNKLKGSSGDSKKT